MLLGKDSPSDKHLYFQIRQSVPWEPLPPCADVSSTSPQQQAPFASKLCAYVRKTSHKVCSKQPGRWHSAARIYLPEPSSLPTQEGNCPAGMVPGTPVPFELCPDIAWENASLHCHEVCWWFKEYKGEESFVDIHSFIFWALRHRKI